jgi:hypothetical protein
VTNIDELVRQNRLLLEQLAQQAERLDELTNKVAALEEENQRLRDEIAVLKKQKPRPKIPPSKLEGPKSKDKESKPKTSRGKHPRKNKTKLPIHEEKILQPSSIPKGALFKGFQCYTVQDTIFQPHNTRYKIARWQLPDGSYISGELPSGVCGHYGAELVSYILHQYFACRVTEPLLLEQLHARGVLISAGQLSNILSENKQPFHDEKNELMAAGVKAANQIQTDDTGGRHKGKNQYTTVIGNQWFTVFTTADSKSRTNFFRLLQNGRDEYVINDDTIAYLEDVGSLGYLPGYINFHHGARFTSKASWNEFLAGLQITQTNPIRFVTEAALFASAVENGIPKDLGVHADDAGQFNCFIRSLCWIHEERHYRKIIPTTEQGKADLERVRDQIWTFYRQLKDYQAAPNIANKEPLSQKFDDVFLQTTSSATLNKRLRRTYKNKEKLLRVLERPETPLHNNSSETDIRSAVTKRKVSGGTRSTAGKDARDTFLSLKQTCRKLGINFIDYLKDRVGGLFEIPRLAEVIRRKSEASQSPA